MALAGVGLDIVRISADLFRLVQVGTLSSSHPSSVFSVFFLSFLLPLHDPVDKKSRSKTRSVFALICSFHSLRVRFLEPGVLLRF